MNPSTGRFHTMDTYEGDNGQPLTLHKYVYAADNPVNNIDPSGEEYQAVGTMALIDIGRMFFAASTPALGTGKKAADKNIDFTSIPNRYSAGSPSGGPAANPGAVVCISYLSERKLRCKLGAKVVEANTIVPDDTDDTKPNGPTPVGEYLIDKRRTHPTYQIDWYDLCPRKEDNSGYYSYTQRTKTGRLGMGLHPGTISHGCCTVAAPRYNSDPEWKKVRDLLEQGKLTYRSQQFVGFLYVAK
jgi:hypothetical protein